MRMAREQQHRPSSHLQNTESENCQRNLTQHHFTDDIQTGQYRCPEVILGAKWGASADVGSVACVVSFPLYPPTRVADNRRLFDPVSGSRYSKDDDHIVEMIEHMGKIPKTSASSGNTFRSFLVAKVRSPFLSPSLTLFWFMIHPLTAKLQMNINKLRYWPRPLWQIPLPERSRRYRILPATPCSVCTPTNAQNPRS